MTFAEAELEADSSVISSSGMVMGEVSVTSDVALFGDALPASSLWESSCLTSIGSDFAEDAKGMQAAAGPEQVDRAALRSIRVSMHAKKPYRIRS